MQLLYLGNCRHLNIVNLAANCWFSQCYNTRILNSKLSPYYLVISAWDWRSDWLQTTAEHDVVWSVWAGDYSELSCAHLNGEFQFHAQSDQLIGVFRLVLLTEREVIHLIGAFWLDILTEHEVLHLIGPFWLDILTEHEVLSTRSSSWSVRFDLSSWLSARSSTWSVRFGLTSWLSTRSSSWSVRFDLSSWLSTRSSTFLMWSQCTERSLPLPGCRTI